MKSPTTTTITRTTYTLKEIGITSRNYNYYQSKGLISNKAGHKETKRFTIDEAVFLMILKELRENRMELSLVKECKEGLMRASAYISYKLERENESFDNEALLLISTKLPLVEVFEERKKTLVKRKLSNYLPYFVIRVNDILDKFNN